MNENKLASNIISEGEHILSKVPEITILFWIIKILTTGMGEAASDYISFRLLGPRVALGVFGGCLVVSLILQFKARQYVTWIYWLNIALISVFGTMIADGLHLKPTISTTIFAVIVAIILIAWYISEKTLDIHSIYTKRREAFYWATVMATFALGTAAGDMAADALHLGFLLSGIIFVGIIAIPAVAYKLFNVNKVFTFWFAYIITRPLGASFADWMDSPIRRGGLGWSQPVIVSILISAIIILVAYMWYNRMDVKYKINGKEQLQGVN